MESTKDNRIWHKGPPPHVGWWNASICRSLSAWRWWDGKRWSETLHAGNDSSYAARCAIRPDNFWTTADIEWTDYYPENARVPRIDPDAPKVTPPGFDKYEAWVCMLGRGDGRVYNDIHKTDGHIHMVQADAEFAAATKTRHIGGKWNAVRVYICLADDVDAVEGEAK